jgi:tRNA A-37 threonylcarbamoyl transferase component Bud32
LGIGSSTYANFWKSSNNNKFKLNNFIKKNKKSSKMRTNNFMSMNKLKEDRGSTEQKYALNSKLFEQFINQYEEKIKKALLDIGVNPEKCKDTNKDYFSNQYDKYFNNLPILNKKNNTEHKRSNDLNNFRLKNMKQNKMFSSFEKTNHLEEKEYITENINNNNDNNNAISSNNSNNGNNNIILKNSFNKNFASNLDSTNINTKSHTINSVNSAKGKDNKKLISIDSKGIENNNLATYENINTEKMENIKKTRAVSSNPYIVKANIYGNKIRDNNVDTNLKIKDNHYYNSANASMLFRNKKSENKLSNYEIGHTLGKGAYAVVKICRNKLTGEKYAMKIYEKSRLNDNSKKKCVYREIEILKRINHKNIAKLHDVITTDKQILILQELVNGISLREYYNNEIRNQKGISEHKSKIFKKIFRQIFDAMNYIHKRNMAHRDIKLENILINKNYEVKIIDFGFGMYNPENRPQNFFCGTPNYMAPEIACKKPYNGQKADLWSLGVLVYKLYCADFPFKGKNEKDLYKSIQRGKFRMASYTPDYVKKIIVSMIDLNPNRRMSCENVLKSEWLKDDE